MTISRQATRALEKASPGLCAEWDALVDQCGSGPFSRPGWVQAWASAMGHRLVVATHREGDQLRAVIPLVRVRGGVGVAADWHTPQVCIAALGRASARSVVAASLVGSTHVIFDFIDAAGDDAAAVRQVLADANFSIRERVRLRPPSIDLSQGWGEFAASIPTKRWREIRRRRRRLAELGEITVAIEDGSEALGSLLDEGLAVEPSGWKAAAGTAVSASSDTDGFYRQVAAWAAQRGELRLAFLRLDGRALAFDFTIEHGQTQTLLKTGFDPEFAKFAPATLLRAEVLERASAAGVTLYDLAGDDEPWKREWSDATRDLVRIEGHAPTMRGRTMKGAQAAHRQLRRAVRSVRSGPDRTVGK